MEDSTEDEYDTDVSLPLREFLEQYQLPQTVKVIEGVYDSTSGLDFANGEVFTLHQKLCSAVDLWFQCPLTSQRKSVTVESSHPARFLLLKFDPGRPHLKDGNNIMFPCVGDLIRACPTLVRASKPYSSRNYPQLRFKAGDLIRPLRIVRERGRIYLQCRFARSASLLKLPMDCVGNFEIVEDPFYYTLHELIYALPRPRRMRLAPDIINEQFRIKGIPRGFNGTIMMNSPKPEVLASPSESPGNEIIIPIDVGIVVSPRDDTYMGPLQHEYLLQEFAVDNEKSFPLEARVTGSEEQTNLMERCFIQNDTVLTMFQHTSRPKYALQHQDHFFLVPHRYDGIFSRAPRRFNFIGDLLEQGPLVVKVVKGADFAGPRIHGTTTGTLLQLLPEEPHVIRDLGTNKQEVEVLKMKILNQQQHSPVINVPLSLPGIYEEVLEDTRTFKLDRVDERDMPLLVTLKKAGAARFKGRDNLPLNKPMNLHSLVLEPCVLVTVRQHHGAPLACHIPMRTKIYTTLHQKETTLKLPDVSNVVEVVESVTKEDCDSLFFAYSQIDLPTNFVPAPPLPQRERQKPVPAPRRKDVEHHARAQNVDPDRDEEPPPGVPLRSPTRSGSLLGHLYAKDVRPPPQEPRETARNQEDFRNYPVVADPVTIPKDDNVINFTAEEMFSLLHQLNVGQKCLHAWFKDKIDGEQFGKMSNEDLNKFGLGKNRDVLYYRDHARSSVFKQVL